MITANQQRQHNRACKLLGVDPTKVRIVGASEWKEIVGEGVGRNYGKSSYRDNVVYVKRTAGYDTHVHEVLHLLFPSRPHWWIFGAAFKLSGIMHGHPANAGSWRIYGQDMSAARVKESRVALLLLARTSARRRGFA